MNAQIDARALCHANTIGEESVVGPYSLVEQGAELGARIEIGSHVVIRAGAHIADGVTIGDGAILGRGATVEPGAVIGDAATITAGNTIGAAAVVSAGAVVDRPVPRHAVVSGNPAQITGYVALDETRAMEPLRASSTSLASESSAVVDTEVRGVKICRLHQARDLRGSLVAAEIQRLLPFIPHRYFLVFDVPGAQVRGEHAHRTCHQFLMAVHGELNVIADDGEGRQEFVLDDRTTGLYIPPLVWGVQYKYSADCVLLVLASHPYDDTDYIRDYREFLAEIQDRSGRS